MRPLIWAALVQGGSFTELTVSFHKAVTVVPGEWNPSRLWKWEAALFSALTTTEMLFHVVS